VGKRIKEFEAKAGDVLLKTSPAFSKRPRGFAARKTRKDVIHKERFSFP